MLSQPSGGRPLPGPKSSNALPAGIYRVDQGQPVQDLCPDGSYVIPYEDIQKSTYNKQVVANCILWVLTMPA